MKFAENPTVFVLPADSDIVNDPVMQDDAIISESVNSDMNSTLEALIHEIDANADSSNACDNVSNINVIDIVGGSVDDICCDLAVPDDNNQNIGDNEIIPLLIDSDDSDNEDDLIQGGHSCAANVEPDAADEPVPPIRRGIPRPSGIYVKGKLNSTKVIYTVDSGASATMISERTYNQVAKGGQLRLLPSNKSFLGPTGGQLDIIGSVNALISLGSAKIKREVTVARGLSEDILLGADILLGLEQGPFNFLLTENRLEWNGHSIPCIQVGKNDRAAATCKRTITIPGYAEAIVEADIIGIFNNSEALLEAHPTFVRRTKALVATSLVSIDSNRKINMRIMNPYKQNITIRQGEKLGELHEFQTSILQGLLAKMTDD